jgi:signal transduction histidine kinase
LFNFIQNAVKYNLNNGEIMINYSLQERARMSSNSINAAPTIELVTKITDTGKGIE